jgi:methyltransferase (TIGR00027 family)
VRDDQPSLTAQRVAVQRAEHQVFDRPKVFEDPLALAIIGPEKSFLLDSKRREYGRLASRSTRSRRAFLVARSRYAEDQLARSIERGVTQYVVLGAGLDTFGYRNPHCGRNLRVFEVDHPATQKWKLERLQTAKIVIPSSVTFVAIDFERQSLEEGLKDAGFRFGEASFFSWLGVTQYLSKQAVMATLRSIRSLSAKNGVVFSYAVERSPLNWVERMRFYVRARKVSRIGEPFRNSFEPEILRAELSRLGFCEIEDMDAQEINSRYFRDRTDGLCMRSNVWRLIGCFGAM